MNLAEAKEHYGVREWGVRAPLAVRILRRTIQDGDCWVWTGVVGTSGYGQMAPPPGGSLMVHRTSYEFFVGPIASGLQIDHLCKRRACLRPSHLEPVSASENNRRSATASTVNALKQACPAGHAYSVENTYRINDERRCKTCLRAGRQRRRQRARSAAT